MESQLKPDAYFHQPSEAVRFWVLVDQQWIGASIARAVLHYSYCAHSNTDEPMDTYRSHAPEIEAAVRRRWEAGSSEPIMLREHDLRPSSR